MITSAPLDSSGTPSTLIKPRNWPACFKESAALKVFLNKTIKGKKVRLTAQPPPDIAEALKDVVAATGSNADMVMEISRALGWEVVRGVAIFEVEQQPGVFVAQERAWNLHPRNIWVRLGDAEHEELVLVEADTARLASKMRPSTQANDEDDDPLPTSFDDALKLISVGPKAAANGGRFPKQRPKGKYAEEDPESEFVARPGRRPVWVGEPPNETKKVVDWPGKCTKVRLRVNLETKTFDLEARCWGAAAWQGDDKDKDLMAEIYGGEVEWFAPPEYGDEKAAVLSVSGRLHITDDSKGASNDFVRMLVDTVDEQRNGKRRPPITSDDIYSACGKSLLNPIECSWRKFGQNLSLKLDRRSDWSVGFDMDQSR